MRRIILFKGELDTINLFSEQMKKGFEELGDYEIFEFDLQDTLQSLAAFYRFVQSGPVTAMIGFNSCFYMTRLPSGGNLCEQLQIPCVNILVDHPYWYPEILQNMPSLGAVLCVDRNHMNYVNRMYPEIAVNGFLPHGGTPMTGRPKAIKDRHVSVFYAGSLYAEYANRQKPDFSGWDFPAEEICETAIERLKENPEQTIEYAVETVLRERGVELTDAELCRFIASCVYIERVVSSYFREKALAYVAKAGIPLEICGNGWGGCDWLALPNVRYLGRIRPEEVLHKMEDTKLVLNTMPWFKDGSHERVFNGMLRGAVVCSETSAYLEEELPLDAWISYDLSEMGLKLLPERIKQLLADEHLLQQIADRGYEFAGMKHTWQARAGELHRDLLSIWG